MVWAFNKRLKTAKVYRFRKLGKGGKNQRLGMISKGRHVR